MMIQKVEEQDILMIYSSIDSGKDDLNSKDLTDNLLKKLKWGKNIVDITGKNMPVILWCLFLIANIIKTELANSGNPGSNY